MLLLPLAEKQTDDPRDHVERRALSADRHRECRAHVTLRFVRAAGARASGRAASGRLRSDAESQPRRAGGDSHYEIVEQHGTLRNVRQPWIESFSADPWERASGLVESVL